MSKLFAEMDSDKHGRKASKGGDEEISIALNNGNMRIFDITFRDDGNKRGTIEVLSLRDSKTTIIEY